MPEKIDPNHFDIVGLISAFERAAIDYIVIGGMAMMIHGYPRMTKDLDIVIPIDQKNNEKLIRALSLMPEYNEGLSRLDKTMLDKGFSTAIQGVVPIDLLFVAADKTYEDYKPYIQKVTINGRAVTTLDVDGMLLSKDTTRESDIPDRLKLGKLKNLIYKCRENDREENLKHFSPEGAAELFFWEALTKARDDNSFSSWKSFEDGLIDSSMSISPHLAQEVAHLLCEISPGAVYKSRQDQILSRAMKILGPEHPAAQRVASSSSPRPKG